MAETWHEITYDSYIVDVRRVRKTKAEGYSKAVAEVCKYALKFSDLSTENTWQAFLSLKGKRLTGSFGSMHGVKIPDTATPDDKPSEELPYMEMLYRFVFGPKSYYNLEITKDVKPNGWQLTACGVPCTHITRLLHDASQFFGRGEGTQHVKKRKDTYRPLHDLVRGSTP